MTVRRRFLLVAVLALLVVFFLVCTGAYAAPPGWQILSIPWQGTNPSDPALDGGRVVWVASVGTGTEVFLYDAAAGSTTQLTTDGSDKKGPVVSGDYVAWFQNQPGAQNRMTVAVLDLKTHAQTTVGSSVVSYPGLRVDGSVIVFADYVSIPGKGQSYEFFAYDMKNKTLTQVSQLDDTSLMGDSYPVVTGTYVAGPWRNGTQDVWLYDLTARSLTRLTNNATQESSLEAGGGHLLWQRSDGQATQVVLYDIASKTLTQLSNQSGSSRIDRTPSGESVNERYAVWTGPYPGSGETAMLFDIAAKQTIQLSGDFIDSSRHPTLADDFVAFEGRLIGGGAYANEVFVYVPPLGRFIRLTTNAVNETVYTADGTSVLFGNEGTYPTATNSFYLATYNGSLVGDTFKDVTALSPYRDAIQELADWGIIGGYETAGGREFRPTQPVFRAQFAKMICGSLEKQATEDLWNPFADLGPDDPNNLYPHEWVALAAQLGITRGIAPGQFGPYVNISRAQVVTMVVRGGGPGVLYLPDNSFIPTLGNFSDTHSMYMAIAEYMGLLEGLQGFGPGWDPWAPASRGEVAQILSNLRALMTVPGAYW